MILSGESVGIIENKQSYSQTDRMEHLQQLIPADGVTWSRDEGAGDGKAGTREVTGYRCQSRVQVEKQALSQRNLSGCEVRECDSNSLLLGNDDR